MMQSSSALPSPQLHQPSHLLWDASVPSSPSVATAPSSPPAFMPSTPLTHRPSLPVHSAPYATDTSSHAPFLAASSSESPSSSSATATKPPSPPFPLPTSRKASSTTTAMAAPPLAASVTAVGSALVPSAPPQPQPHPFISPTESSSMTRRSSDHVPWMQDTPPLHKLPTMQPNSPPPDESPMKASSSRSMASADTLTSLATANDFFDSRTHTPERMRQRLSLIHILTLPTKRIV